MNQSINPKEDRVMDSRTEVLVMLGAAIGANCIPCFDHLYAKATETRLAAADIEKVVELAFKVKNGAGVFLKKAVGECVKLETASAQGCCDHDCVC
jgi:acyl-coenzyme A synthetase/AMP-(fatty) acid ligase